MHGVVCRARHYSLRATCQLAVELGPGQISRPFVGLRFLRSVPRATSTVVCSCTCFFMLHFFNEEDWPHTWSREA
jgi:hypothetical protein